VQAEGGGGPVPVGGEGGLGTAPLPHEPLSSEGVYSRDIGRGNSREGGGAPLKRARVAIPLPSVPREERRPAAPGATGVGAGAGVGLGLFALPWRDVSEAEPPPPLPY